MITGRERLVTEARRLKMALLVSRAIRGTRGVWALGIGTYDGWTRAKLEAEVAGLHEEVYDTLKEMVTPPRTKEGRERAIGWLEEQFTAWKDANFGVFSMGTVADFEDHVGPLRQSLGIETPPYGEMLLQGISGFAIRHPEYMLVRDLGLLVELHGDAVGLLKTGPRTPTDVAWRTACQENRQSLARSAIIACFNLIEAFSNGLARAALMTAPSLNEATRTQLADTGKKLRTRLLTVVRLVSGGRCSLDVNKPPMSVLFGDISTRRNAFVHCEPGPQAPSRGEVNKEEAFHDVSPDVVDKAVRATVDVIRSAWRDVHQREGPLWLSHWDGERFHRLNMRLARDPGNGET